MDVLVEFARDQKDKEAETHIYLVNGIKLTGIIEQADPDGLILSRGKQEQAVNRSAIATIVPVNGH